MIQKTADIITNQQLSDTCWRMRLAAGPAITASARPGQFVMVRPNGGDRPFLPRPFSIHRINKENGSLDLLYKVIGPGTRRMSGLNAGDGLAVTGPLGSGFRIEQQYENISIIGGGIGLAPLVFLADVLAAETPDPFRAEVFIGAATADEILCRDEFIDLKMGVHIATDDGSAGHHGFVTELFGIITKDNPPDMIFACGPPAMLRATAKITASRNIPCQISIETIMACGIGACLGCAVKPAGNTSHYLHACRQGPVFFSSEIDINSLV
jgi:dihydroorotate dehydrogenase electron transfer subunit